MEGKMEPHFSYTTTISLLSLRSLSPLIPLSSNKYNQDDETFGWLLVDCGNMSLFDDLCRSHGMAQLSKADDQGQETPYRGSPSQGCGHFGM